ncbi:Nucleotidyltransferase domain protein [Candidatus Methylomirabilis lanthanidiphila]|uniref:Nucleotidyltransferase domain protein n=1 Tax=Candidatus Methylomirabilis lanthanidiphila TaxID=2211376 RepID=A0A564ZJG1_9BACT|nr:nucleotidyltransferase domain-containing protein [Candidatus Methylomirabilis lanthanidiphila]VUZ85246.1 Nucleotidyltransferase domain protein [Candidatus Methylomirabilis lanthanidiphila]
MLTKEEITKVLREIYPYMASEYGVKRIGLFGSYAKDTPTETSDLDLVVEFDRPRSLSEKNSHGLHYVCWTRGPCALYWPHENIQTVQPRPAVPLAPGSA